MPCPPATAVHTSRDTRTERRYALLLVGMGATGVLLAGCANQQPTRPETLLFRLSDEQAHDVAIHALGLVGTPYRFGGNTPEGGFDCSGLIHYVYRQRTGMAPPRTVAALGQFGQPLAAGAARTGDLVLFGAPVPTHAGIYVGDGRFVHAPSTGGTVRLDHLQARHWAREFAGFRRP